MHSISADPKFIDPENYDLRVADDSPALKLGFKNFPMDTFGVRKPEFRKIGEAAHKKYQKFRPEQIWGSSGSADTAHGEPKARIYTCLGAKVKELTTEEEKSVAAVGELTGVYVIEVPQGSAAARAGIVAGDAILAVNGRKVANVAALRKRLKRGKRKTVELHVVGATDRKIKLEIE
ncbi:MAG: PDZ domain-containing protein [Planctomycetota bacterium]